MVGLLFMAHCAAKLLLLPEGYLARMQAYIDVYATYKLLFVAVPKQQRPSVVGLGGSAHRSSRHTAEAGRGHRGGADKELNLTPVSLPVVMPNPLRRHLDSGDGFASGMSSPSATSSSSPVRAQGSTPRRKILIHDMDAHDDVPSSECSSSSSSSSSINRIGPLSPPDHYNSDTSLESLEKSLSSSVGSSTTSSFQATKQKSKVKAQKSSPEPDLVVVSDRARIAIVKFQSRVRGYITRRLLYIILTSNNYLTKKASGYDLIFTVLKSCAMVRKIFLQMLMCNLLMEGYTEGVDVKLALDERERAFANTINSCNVSKRNIETVIENDRAKYANDMEEIKRSVEMKDAGLAEELSQLSNSYKVITDLNTVRLKDVEIKTKSVLRKEFKAILTIISGYNYKMKRLREKLELIDDTESGHNKYRKFFLSGKQYLRIKIKFCLFDSVLKTRLSTLMLDLQKSLKDQDEAILRLDSTYDPHSYIDTPVPKVGGTPGAMDVSTVSMSVLSDASDTSDSLHNSPISSIRRLRALKMSKLEQARDIRQRTLNSSMGYSSDDTEETDDSESIYSGTDFTNESGDNTDSAPISPAGRSPAPTAKVDRELLLSMMVKKDSKTKDSISLGTSPKGKGSTMQALIEEYKAKEDERRTAMLEEHLRVEALKASLDNDDSYLGNFSFNLLELMPAMPAVGQMAASTAAAVRDGLVDPVVGSINKYTVEPVVGTISETAGAVRSYTVDPVVETAGTVSRYTFEPVVGSLSGSVEAIVQPLYPSSLISGISSSVADWTGSAVLFPSAVYSAAVAATSAPEAKVESPNTSSKRKSKKKDKIITQASPLEYDDILELNKSSHRQAATEPQNMLQP